MNCQATVVEPSPRVRSFHVVTKAVGSRCNLDCTYCYYLHKDELLPDTAGSRISDELLEESIRQYIAGQDLDPVIFNWHGGEPMLLGLDFFRKAIELQRKYVGTKRIQNDLQTNGVLLDESWCRFLKEHEFNVGLSIDGPKHLHDQFRRAKGGQPTFDRVYRGARLLQQHQVPFNVLVVINSVNARHPEEVYRFFTEDLGCSYLQWLPCVAPKEFRTVAPGYWDAARMPILGTAAAKPGNPESVVTDWSVDPDDWGDFLSQTFYLWLKHGIGSVFVNWFESMVGQWMHKPAQICTLDEICGRSLVTMENDGSVYSCDHFVYPEHRLGNLRDKDARLVDMVYSPQQRKFATDKRDLLPEYCRKCSYLFACNGECPKNRFIRTPDGEPGLNYLCSGNRRFFEYAAPYFRQVVAEVHRSVTIVSPDQKVPSPLPAKQSRPLPDANPSRWEPFRGVRGLE